MDRPVFFNLSFSRRWLLTNLNQACELHFVSVVFFVSDQKLRIATRTLNCNSYFDSSLCTNFYIYFELWHFAGFVEPLNNVFIFDLYDARYLGYQKILIDGDDCAVQEPLPPITFLYLLYSYYSLRSSDHQMNIRLVK